MGLTKELLETHHLDLSNGKKFLIKTGKKYKVRAPSFHGLPPEEGILQCSTIYKYPDGYIQTEFILISGDIPVGSMAGFTIIEEIQ